MIIIIIIIIIITIYNYIAQTPIWIYSQLHFTILSKHNYVKIRQLRT